MRKITIILAALMVLLSLSSCATNGTEQVLGKKIAVSQGAYVYSAAQKLNIENKEIITYTLSSDVVLAVENGKADFGIIDEFDTFTYTSAGRNIAVSDVCDYSVEFSFCLNSSDEDLCRLINNAILELKAEGVLDNIKKSYIETGTYNITTPAGNNGTLVLGCDPSFEHRAMLNSYGNVYGIDIAVASEICKRIGYSLDVVTGDYDEVFYKLSQGEVDFVAAQNDSGEKEKSYLITESYLKYNFNLITRK